MTDAKNNAEKGLESANTPKVFSPSEALTTVIRTFIESQINHSQNGVQFYIALANATSSLDLVARSNLNLVAKIGDFVTRLKDFPDYKNLAQNTAFFEYLKTDETLFKKVRARALFEGRKIAQTHETAFREFTARYEISDKKDIAKLRSAIQAEPLSALQKRIKEGSYDDLAKSVLGEKTAEAANLKSIEQEKILASTFGKAVHSLDDEEKENLQIAMMNGSLWEESLRPLLEKLGPAGRRELLKGLRTTLSLEVLVDLGIVSSDRARSMIRDDLLSRTFLPAETADPELLKEIENAINQAVVSVNLSDYRIPTQSLDATTIDIFSKTPQFAELIGDQLNTLTKEFNKSRRSPNVSTQTTAEQLVENVLPKSVGIHSAFIEYLAESVRQNKPAYIIQKVVGSDNQEHTVYLRVENWDDARRSVDVYRLWVDDNMLASNSKGNKDIVLYTEFAAELENSSHLTFLDKEAFDWRIEGVSKLSEEPEPISLETVFGVPSTEDVTLEVEASADTSTESTLPEELDLTIDPDVLDADIDEPSTHTETPEPVTATGGGAGGNVPPPPPPSSSSSPTPENWSGGGTNQPPSDNGIEFTPNALFKNDTVRQSVKDALRARGIDIRENISDKELSDLSYEWRNAPKVSNTSVENNTAQTPNATAESQESLTENWSYEKLLEKINEIDPEGAEFGLKVGTTFMTNTPGSGTAEFGILHITKIREPQDGIPGAVVLKDDLGGNFELSFHNFYKAFKGKAITKSSLGQRIAPVVDASGFLTAIKSEHPNKWAFDGVEFDQETHRFTEKSRADEKNYKGTRFFINDGFAVEIISHDGPNVKINFFTDVNSNEKKTKFKGNLVLEEKEISYQALATLFLRYSLTPSLDHRDGTASIKPIETQSIDESQTKPGHIKHWFGKLSINDVMHGGKQFIDFIKEKIAHGNHLQEARVMLMLGRGIGLDQKNNDWFLDLKAKVENNEKKLVEERLEELGKMGGPDRQRSIYESLMNHGSHDYEHWASVFSMLEKHGTLYVGTDLRKLEGSYIFFKRVAGLPLGADVAHNRTFQELKRKLDDAQEPVTEEGIIREYMKAAGGGGRFNSLMWIMARGKWADGIRGETESGKKEWDGFMTMERRVSNSMGKLRENEYSKGIGAALSISDKPGSAAMKHTPWFALAISRKPERFHQDVLQSLHKHYDEGRTHSPALMFLKDPSSQDLFRKTVGILCEINDKRTGSTSMQNGFREMMKAVNEPELFNEDSKNKSFETIEKFWKTYGEILQPQLTMTALDPVIMYAEKDYPILKEYKKRVNSELGDTDFSNTETNLGTYFSNDNTGASVVYAKPEAILKKVKVNATNVTVHANNDTLSEFYLKHFVDSVKRIKQVRSTQAEIDGLNTTIEAHSKEKQKILYSILHKEFYKFALQEFGKKSYESFWSGPFSEFTRDTKFNSRDIGNIPYGTSLSSPEYKSQLDQDFDAFIQSGSNLSANDVLQNTPNAANAIMQQAA